MTADDGDRQALELAPGERLLQSWTVVRSVGADDAAGTLLLTTQRLRFEQPQTVKRGRRANLAALFGRGSGALAATTRSLHEWPLGDLAGADPVPGGARVRVTTTGGESWEFEINASLRQRGSSAIQVALRDAAVLSIRFALAPPGATRAQPQPDIDVAALRRRAVSTGEEVTAFAERDLRVYATPDGVVRAAMGSRSAAPADAAVDLTLAGGWRLERFGEDEVVTLEPDGSVTGQIRLFPTHPPLALSDGRWWSEGPSSLHVGFDLHAPQFDGEEMPSHYEFGASVRIDRLESDVAVVTISFDGEPSEFTLRRAPPPPAAP